jgi:hypothetical protein
MGGQYIPPWSTARDPYEFNNFVVLSRGVVNKNTNNNNGLDGTIITMLDLHGRFKTVGTSCTHACCMSRTGMRVTNGISGGRIGYRRIYFYSYDTRESIKQCRIASEKKSRAETISEKDAWAESMPSRKGRTRQNALALKVQRALGIDYGRRHIGVAVSTMGLAPRPLTYIRGGGLLEIMRMSEDVVNVAVEERACDDILIVFLIFIVSMYSILIRIKRKSLYVLQNVML